MALGFEFTQKAYKQYKYWAENDKKILKKINELIKAAQENPCDGKGKPEALKFNLTGCWSRRINQEHRLVYMVEGEKIIILQCKYHY